MSVEKSTRVEDLPETAGDWRKWFDRLESFSALKDGWNGYSAPAPGQVAVGAARAFLSAMREQDYAPTRVAPSAMGGVGITRRQGERKVYVEFYNDGTGHALFSGGLAGMHTRPLAADAEGVRVFLAEMRNYLNG